MNPSALDHPIRIGAGLAIVMSLVWSGAAVAQSPRPGVPLSPADSADLRDDLEHAVDTYERSRRRYAPTDWFGDRGGPCDEYIGRMCLTLGEGSDWWFPEEIPERMERERTRLLTQLEDGHRRLPGDAWLLGQLVRYLGEGGDWERARGHLDPCPPVEHAWCGALHGLALHGQGRYVDAERAFGEALAAMPPDRRREWLDPDEVADDGMRDRLDTLSGAGWDAEVERFWRLSDPFMLAPGNDRWTEHLARRTMIEIRYGRDSAYRIRFRDDLTEVTLRYGWEVGWERRPAPAASVRSETSVVGHQHPYSLPWALTDEVALEPVPSTAEAWIPQSQQIPRTGYAPLYAPNILPDGEVLLFPRGRETVVVASIVLPRDTSWHADHDHPPLPILPAFTDLPSESGLFALDASGRVSAGVRAPRPETSGETDNGPGEGDDPRTAADSSAPVPGSPRAIPYHHLTLPTGDWVVSLEYLAPAISRGARLRSGLRIEERLLDQPTLSDLLLLPAEPEPVTLEQALGEGALRRAAAGDRFRVGWETWGLGRDEEAFSYTLTLSEDDGGIVDRVAGWLGLGGDDVVSDLEWTERGPDGLGAHFRSIEVELPPDLADGRYVLRLVLATPGRNPLVSERRLAVGR